MLFSRTTFSDFGAGIRVRVTKEMARIGGESQMKSTARLEPCTTLRTPSGRPACSGRDRDVSDESRSRVFERKCAVVSPQ